MYLLEL